MGDRFDVIVAGGGPAGAAAGALLARRGHRVLLLEKERFPRFRIGESLMPAAYWPLRRLGVLEKLAGTAFPRKHSVQFFQPDGRPTAPFYFSEVDPHESSVTWQVDRAEFDRILLEHAAGEGVEVRHEAAVTEVLLEGGRAEGVRASRAGAPPEEIRARVVVDATGQDALLSKRLRLKAPDPRLRNAAFFTRFRGALRDAGRDEGATLILHTAGRDSWFWYIPLPDDTVSVGVVGSIDHLLKGREGGPQRVFDEEAALCPALRRRLERAEQAGEVRVLMDFSYISSRIAGDGWVLVGDAFGFLDPIYSSGVFLALQGAELAADAIHDALEADDPSAARLGRHGPRFVAGMESIRRLVYAFYAREFSFSRFLGRHPGAREELVNLLIGNVYRRPCNGLMRALAEELPLSDYRPLSLPGD